MLRDEEDSLGVRLASARAVLEGILDSDDRYSLAFETAVRSARQSATCALLIWAAGLELETHDNPLSIDYPRRLREGAEHA